MPLTCYFAFKKQTSKVTVKMLFTENCPILKRIALSAFELGGIILKDNYRVIWIRLCTDCAPDKVRSQVTY
jgi:hypothetical protein